MLLRDGSETSDERLDRLQQFDERSRNFPVQIDASGLRTKTWRLNERNDQGPDGACVGFGVGHRLAAQPLERGGIDYNFSFSLYKEAQRLDPWEGEEYSGTSVLAGIKAARARGYVDEFRWCFTIEDIMRAVAWEGPVVVGTWWDFNMFQPRPSGLLEMGGGHAGGHCYLIRGLTLKPRLRGESLSEPVFRVTNSWGPGWGVKGEAYIRVSDFEDHLMPGGEAVLPNEIKTSSRRVARAFAPSRWHWWNHNPNKPWRH